MPDNSTGVISDVFDYQGSYMFPAYSFERPIYLYIWEILVISLFLMNAVVIQVYMRKRLRNSINLIFVAIAISDSMTGLVTLPTYMMVYSRFQPPLSQAELYAMDYYEMTTLSVKTVKWSTVTPTSSSDALNRNISNDTNLMNKTVTPPLYSIYYGYIYIFDEGRYELSENLCVAFMISKLFLSKFFRTISIFLTLFLGFQRYISVAYPFKARTFFTNKITVIVCAVIFVLSPILHVYHLQDDKTHHGMCTWRLDNCEGDCAFLWIILIIRHLTPCCLLSVFTVLFVKELRKNRMEMDRERSRLREEKDKRVTVIVISISIVFLVAEIPYGVFLLIGILKQHVGLRSELKQNRAVHAAYEILLVLSFHANFYIYTVFNMRFRSELKRILVHPIRKALGRLVAWLPSSSLSSKSASQRKNGELQKVSTNTSDEYTSGNNWNTSTTKRGLSSWSMLSADLVTTAQQKSRASLLVN